MWIRFDLAAIVDAWLTWFLLVPLPCYMISDTIKPCDSPIERMQPHGRARQGAVNMKYISICTSSCEALTFGLLAANSLHSIPSALANSVWLSQLKICILAVLSECQTHIWISKYDGERQCPNLLLQGFMWRRANHTEEDWTYYECAVWTNSKWFFLWFNEFYDTMYVLFPAECAQAHSAQCLLHLFHKWQCTASISVEHECDTKIWVLYSSGNEVHNYFPLHL